MLLYAHQNPRRNKTFLKVTDWNRKKKNPGWATDDSSVRVQQSISIETGLSSNRRETEKKTKKKNARSSTLNNNNKKLRASPEPEMLIAQDKSKANKIKQMWVNLPICWNLSFWSCGSTWRADPRTAQVSFLSSHVKARKNWNLKEGPVRWESSPKFDTYLKRRRKKNASKTGLRVQSKQAPSLMNGVPVSSSTLQLFSQWKACFSPGQTIIRRRF